MASKGKGIADDYDSSKRKRYDDNDDGSGRRKRRNPAVLQFFEDSACEVDESGSSDDDDFFDNLFPEEAFFQVKTEPAKTPDLPIFPKEEEMSEEELEKMLDERYKPGSSYVTYAEDRFEANRPQESNTFMPSSVPSAKEPTLWKVKCMAGRERHSAFCLMQKYVDLHALGTKLHIISAFAVDHIKSYIYIEADKQSDITEACKGICSIYSSRAAPVTMSEVPNLFSVRSKCSGIAVDTWARVKSGKYKGDLAQVVAVNESQRKATVKLIPRIDLQAMAEKFGGGVKGKRVATPAPRLISSSELEDFRPLIQYRRDRDTGNIYEIFDGMMLKDGYLFKKVSLDSLSFWGVDPSQDELLRFEPPKDKESDDLEFLTGLFGERKKKKIIQNDKVGGKGESSSSSMMEDGFEVSDLVFHGRNGFGIVIGTEKDDKLRVLKEGSDKPVVVSAEPRLLKKASFEKKFTALDQQKKIISINDTVRVLEGPLEDKQGVVKQIYKGIIFLHDEIEQENGGYFCAKAQICEKVELFGDACKGKGGKGETSGFDGFSSSPKSPLSPKKPWEEGQENSRSFNREDKDGFSVGQSLRIKVGPLKGYLCRVLAIRYSDVTVKLDSQQKILTVKSEHLAEVRGKATGVSLGEEPDSAKPFDLIGSDASQGWMNGGATATEGGGWNTGGPSTERTSSWAPFPSSSLSLNAESSANAFNSLDTDLNKDVGASTWDIKVTPSQGSAWGASAVEEKAVVNTEEVGGWGKATSSAGNGNSGASSWGKAKVSNDIQADPSTDARDNWGRASTDTSKGVISSWGKSSASNNEDSGWRKPEEPSDKGKSILGTPPSSSWGKTDSEKNPVDSWGKGTGGSGQATWGKAVEPSNEGPGEDSWGKAADTLTNIHGSSGSKSAWNSASVPASQTGGWGNKSGDAAQSNIEASGWEKGGASSGVQTEKWGSTKNDGEDTKGGWGKGGFGSQGQSDSWGRGGSGADGGSSWSNKNSQKEGEQATAWGKQGNSEGWNKAKTFGANAGSADGGSSWTKEEGGSSWNKQGGGSSWSNQDGGSSWGKPSGGSSWSGQADGTEDKQSWQRTNDFGSDRGGSGGRRGGRGGRGDRGGRNGGGDRSAGQGECFKCGQSGHFARECPSSGGGDRSAGQGDCFKCGLSGHFARECPSSGGGDRSAGQGDCFKCGQSGHRARDCPSSGGGDRSTGQGECFKCGQSGHFARECPSSGGGDRSAGQGDCFKCGVSGHRARECPSSGGGDRPGGRDCFKCGQSGHFARECPSSGDGQSGGGRGGRSFDRDGSSGGWSKGQNSYGGTSAGENKFSNWSSGQASGGWGSSNKDSNVGTTGWKNDGDEAGKWGSTKEEGDSTTGGWGKGGSDSWSKPKDSGGDGGSSWNNNNNNQGDNGGSSWSKPTWNNDNKDDESNRTFEGGRGSGGRRGRGGRGGGRDNYGRGGGRSSSGQWGEQSSSWKGGNSSGWGNSSGQASAGWGTSQPSDGNKKGDQTTTGWGANGGETGGGWGSGMKTFGGKKDDAEGSGGWKNSEGGTVDQAGGWGNSNAGKKDDAEGSGWKKDEGNQGGSWGAKKDDQGAAGWGKGTGNWS